MSKKALGKGLGAFIPDEFSILKDERFAEIDVEDVKPNPFQPRVKFDDQTIEELAQSIKETGIVQPVIVVPEDDHYMIIVGERRWRAAQRAGLRKIPVLIRNIPKDKQLEVSLIENIHREELNALEIARAYQRLIDDHGYAQHDLADKVGRGPELRHELSPPSQLPPEIQDRLTDGEISMGHARAMLALEDTATQLYCCRQVIDRGLSVRNTESLVNRLKKKAPGPSAAWPTRTSTPSRRKCSGSWEPRSSWRAAGTRAS